MATFFFRLLHFFVSAACRHRFLLDEYIRTTNPFNGWLFEKGFKYRLIASLKSFCPFAILHFGDWSMEESSIELIINHVDVWSCSISIKTNGMKSLKKKKQIGTNQPNEIHRDLNEPIDQHVRFGKSNEFDGKTIHFNWVFSIQFFDVWRWVTVRRKQMPVI